MLQNEKPLSISSKSSDKVESPDKKILLVYDNIDQIQKNHIVFRWHVRQLLRYSSNIKIIMSQRTK